MPLECSRVFQCRPRGRLASRLASLRCMSSEEEQAEELEALAAIYMQDFEQLGPAQAAIQLAPEIEPNHNHIAIQMTFSFPNAYPHQPPNINLASTKGLNQQQVQECRAMLEDAAKSEQLLGSAMMYTLAEMAQEWMRDRNVPELDMHSAMLARMADSQSRTSNDAAVGDDDDSVSRNKVALGNGDWRGDPTEVPSEESFTPVTTELFAAWRKEYDVERALAADILAKERLKKRGGGGDAHLLTGREIFEQRGGHRVLEDAGTLGECEEDVMLSPYSDDDEDAVEVDSLSGGDDVLGDVADLSLFEEEDMEDDLE